MFAYLRRSALYGAIFVLALSSWAGAFETGDIDLEGQFRFRAVVSDPGTYTSTATTRSTDSSLLRSRLSARAHPVDDLDVFLQLQDSRVSGSEASVASNQANVDLHQGHVNFHQTLGGVPLLVRLGRQELKYGAQRLISPLDWSNVGRSWDGLRLSWGPNHWRIDAFVTTLREVADVQNEQTFSGLYTTCQALPLHTVDFYLLSRELKDGTQLSEAGVLGDLSERTYGARLKGEGERWDYSGEYAFQSGRQVGDRVDAQALAVDGGLILESRWGTRLGLGWTWASGDSNPTDGRRETFHPLFPFGHFYQGFHDLFGWRNGSDYSATLSVEPVERWTFHLDYHYFRLAESQDAWYGANTQAIRRDATGAAGKDVGQELDFHIRAKINKALKLWMGYSRFFAGSYVDRTGIGQDRNWAFFQLVVNF